MPPKSKGTKRRKAKDNADVSEMVSMLVAITSCDTDVALRLLEETNWDVNAAVDRFFSGGASSSPVRNRGPSDVAPASASIERNPDVDDGVRAPIGAKQDTIMSHAELTAQQAALFQPQSHGSARGSGRRNAFLDPFLDAKDVSQRKKRKKTDTHEDRVRENLSKLYAPPHDLIFSGSFEQAKEFALPQRKWVLVNIQDPTEFACQTLNRDVWSNDLVKQLVSENFVFWQRLVSTADAGMYKAIYPFSKLPHIAIIHPMTGERLHEFRRALSPDDFISFVFGFAEENKVETMEDLARQSKSHPADPKPKLSAEEFPTAEESAATKPTVASEGQTLRPVPAETAPEPAIDASPNKQAQLMPEPEKTDASAVTLRFICPDGARLERRFRGSKLFKLRAKSGHRVISGRDLLEVACLSSPSKRRAGLVLSQHTLLVTTVSLPRTTVKFILRQLAQCQDVAAWASQQTGLPLRHCRFVKDHPRQVLGEDDDTLNASLSSLQLRRDTIRVERRA